MLKIAEDHPRRQGQNVKKKAPGLTIAASSGVGPARKAFDLRNIVRAFWWEYHLRQLDLIAMCADTDRRADTARKQSFQHIHEGEKVVMQAINAAFLPDVTPTPSASKE